MGESGHTPCSSCQDCIVEHPILVYGNHKRGQVHTRPRLILRSRKRTVSVPCPLPRTLITGQLAHSKHTPKQGSILLEHRQALIA